MSTEVSYDPETGEIIEAGNNATEMTVSELSQALKRTIEDRFGYVRVRGEISGYRGAHASGHCYFAIKDEGAKLEAVIWRGSFNKLKAKLAEGLEVIASGKLSTFPGKSGYQIIIDRIEPAGAGALMALLEERKKRLAAEGLFSDSRKRRLPYLPELIGIVTSPTGAVIRDILHRLADRFPRHVMVWPVRVQGETAASEVASAIAGFNAMVRPPDVLIIARGGGSIEDLWAFNEEIVVRAVAASAIPIISAVGHETDTTLIDFVSDWRAPTPTAAAEKAVPVRHELVVAIESLEARQHRAIGRMMQQAQTELQAAGRGLPKPQDILSNAWQRMDNSASRLSQSLRSNLQRHAIALTQRVGRLSLNMTRERLRLAGPRVIEVSGRMNRAITSQLTKRRDRLASEIKLFETLGYQATLARGYALVRDAKGNPLMRRADVRDGSRVEIEFADGRVDAFTSKNKDQQSLF